MGIKTKAMTFLQFSVLLLTFTSVNKLQKGVFGIRYLKTDAKSLPNVRLLAFVFKKKDAKNSFWCPAISRKWTPKLNLKIPKSNTPSLPALFVIPLCLSGLVCDSSDLRHDLVLNLPAKDLVPADIVELKVGDKAPADMRGLASLFPLLAGFIIVKFWFCLFSLVYSFLSI